MIGSLLGQMFISTCCVWFELYLLNLPNCIITYLGLLVDIFGMFPKPNQTNPLVNHNPSDQNCGDEKKVGGVSKESQIACTFVRK